jgi:hypothetical protein
LNIKFEGLRYKGQDEVNDGITGFYRNLYEFREVNLDEGDFYDNCPKLSQDNRILMATELSVGDLLLALNKFTDSAPGPDGIP